MLYGTTREFLALFGFESLDELPEIEDVGSLVLSEEEEAPDAGQMTLPIDIE